MSSRSMRRRWSRTHARIRMSKLGMRATTRAVLGLTRAGIGPCPGVCKAFKRLGEFCWSLEGRNG